LKETVIEREDKYFGPVSRSIPNRKGNVELLQGIADGTRGSASANYHCDIIRREGKEMGQQEKKKKRTGSQACWIGVRQVWPQQVRDAQPVRIISQQFAWR
jgi:hypothetical protein